MLEDELDTLDEPSELREARIAAFKAEMASIKLAKEQNHGTLSMIADEKEFFDVTTSVPRVICHFSHPDFRRCAILNKHLEKLAGNHFTTKFCTFDAEKAPFLVTKMQIKILPTVLCFVDGKVKDRLVGFEEVGNTDGFATRALELRLSHSGVIAAPADTEAEAMQAVGDVRSAEPSDMSVGNL